LTPPTWKHVIWDLDGTLLDTYPATDGALLAALQGLGHAVSLEEVRRLTRLTLDHAIRTLANQLGLPEAELYTAYERQYAVLGLNHSPAMPGALEAMRAVRAAGGLNLLATHRDREGADWRLRAVGLDVWLDDLQSVSDGFPRKPEPALFLALLQRHRLDPATVLAVGDRDLDIVAGRAAGCGTALLLTPGTEMDTGADLVLDSLAELAPLFGANL
jgi:HAD superfamily hydrolase (TIGR01509 family)